MNRFRSLSTTCSGLLLAWSLPALAQGQPATPLATAPGSAPAGAAPVGAPAPAVAPIPLAGPGLLYSLDSFGPIKTTGDASATYKKAMDAIMAAGGGTLIIPSNTVSNWRFGNNTQELLRTPAPPAPSKKWETGPGVTVIDTRGGTLRVIPPQLSGMDIKRTFQLPQGQSAPHWSMQPMINLENNVVHGSTSYLDWLIADTPKGKDAKFYVPTIRGLFPGMFITAHERDGYAGAVDRLCIKSLGYEKETNRHFFVADADVDHKKGAIVHNKTHVNVVKMETSAHTELQTFDFFNERRHYSQGDTYLFDGRFYYMGNVHSAAGDENGIVYAAFIHGDTDIFKGVVDSVDNAANAVVFKNGSNADSLGSGRPLINLNPKKWVTAGTVNIVRPASFIEPTPEGRVAKDPVFEGKTYPTQIKTNPNIGIRQIEMGGLIHFSADAPITPDVVGRFFAVDDPSEKVKGRLFRWYLIKAVTVNPNGTKDIRIERQWWGAKVAGAPELYRDENYSSDGKVKALKYVIAPGTNVYDVSQAVVDRTSTPYAGGPSPRKLLVAPSSVTGTPMDFEAGDAIEQAIGADPFHPIPFRAWTFDEVPSSFSAPIFDVANSGAVSRASVLRIAGGDKNGKPAFDSAIRVDSSVNQVIYSRGKVNGALIQVDQKDRSVPITWTYDNGNKESKLWVDNQTGDLNYEGGNLRAAGGVTLVNGGISGTATPASNLRGVNVPVPAGQKSLQVKLTRPEADAEYAIFLETSWLSQRAITEQTAEGFTVTFSEAAPANAKLHWTLVR